VREKGQLKSPVKAEAPCHPNRLPILFLGDSSADFLKLVGPVLGPILFHNVDIGVDRDFFGDETEDLFRRSDSPGHDEVPDEKAPLRNPVGIASEVPYLAMHLFESCLYDLGIVRCVAKLLRMSFVHKFHIRHIDVHDAIEESNHFRRFISRTVIDNRDPKSHFGRIGERGDDLRDIVGRGNEVNIVTAHLLKPKHGLCHACGGDLFAPSQMGDVVVLTEDTSQVAMGEKDGP